MVHFRPLPPTESPESNSNPFVLFLFWLMCCVIMLQTQHHNISVLCKTSKNTWENLFGLCVRSSLANSSKWDRAPLRDANVQTAFSPSHTGLKKAVFRWGVAENLRTWGFAFQHYSFLCFWRFVKPQNNGFKTQIQASVFTFSQALSSVTNVSTNSAFCFYFYFYLMVTTAECAVHKKKQQHKFEKNFKVRSGYSQLIPFYSALQRIWTTVCTAVQTKNIGPRMEHLLFCLWHNL